MQVDPEVVAQVAAEVVLQLVLDQDVLVSPPRVVHLEREVALVMRQALLREDALSRFARLGRALGDEGFDQRVRIYAALLRAPAGIGRGILSVVEQMIELLRHSPHVQAVRGDDDALRRKILHVIARPSRRRKRRMPAGGGGGPPPSGRPPDGLPAEVRAWEVRRSKTPPEPDPDPERRERPGPEGIRKRRN